MERAYVGDLIQERNAGCVQHCLRSINRKQEEEQTWQQLSTTNQRSSSHHGKCSSRTTSTYRSFICENFFQRIRSVASEWQSRRWAFIWITQRIASLKRHCIFCSSWRRKLDCARESTQCFGGRRSISQKSERYCIRRFARQKGLPSL